MADAASTADRREELRGRLRDGAFLRRSGGVPITASDGTGRAWMFYSWAVSTTGAGARLIGEAILDALAIACRIVESRALRIRGVG